MASSLITSINSALLFTYNDNRLLVHRIGLRNLKMLLLCSSGDESSDFFSRVEDAIGRIHLFGWVSEDEVHRLAKELADAWYTTRNLSADEAVEIADSLLQSTVEFLALAGNCAVMVSDFRIVEGESIDAFVVLIKFLRNFLCFVMRIGGELQNVLIEIQFILTNAARVFTTNAPHEDWFEEVQSKCSTLHAMAVDPQFYRACAEALSVPSIQTLEMEDDILKSFLDSLISLLWDMLRHSIVMVHMRDQLAVLYARLRLSRSTLKHNSGWIGSLICDAGMLICSLHQTDVEIDLTQHVEHLLQRFEALQHVEPQSSLPQVLESIPAEPEGSRHRPERFDVAQRSLTEASASASASNPTVEREMASGRRRQPFGFEDDEIRSNVDGLIRGPKQRLILQISGMAGLGKTTFAFQLYNDRSVNYHFHARAWCTISQVLDKKKVLLQLLTQLGQHQSYYLNMSEYELAHQLHQTLKGRRYLLFLDDVWTEEAWSELRISFPDDFTGSRIILTSRNVDIVPRNLLLNGGPFMLRLRTDAECFYMLSRILFPGSESFCNPQLLEFGKLTARKCMGLPLMVVVVAGILATQAMQVWREIMETLSLSNVSHAEQCNTAAELSYAYLPIELQVCFMYFGVFPQCQEISATRLIRLWMGEGFVGENLVARDYLQKLIDRSLVMVVEKSCIHGVKICKIHDLLHDFCRTKAKQYSQYHLLLQKHDQVFNFNEPSGLQRLCIHSDPLHLKESRLFCPLARSILFFLAPESSHESCLFDMSFIIEIYKLLQVMDVQQIPMSSGLPKDICLLTMLKYLSIQVIVCDIPPSIGNLSNLETFIGDFWSYDAISFPPTIWNLLKLNYLNIRNSRHRGHGFCFPHEYLDKCSNLLNLETLSGVVFSSDSNIEEQMRKYPNIRRLKCRILHSRIVVPTFLTQLESLTVLGSGKAELEMGSTTSLRKLTLNGFHVSREEVAAIGTLPVLQALKLLNTTFLGGTLEIEEEGFSQLRVLYLEDTDNSLQRWTGSDSNDILPCLKKLIFSRCGSLEEIPSSLENSSTIEQVQVHECSSALETLVRRIEEVQKDYGNLDLKVDIRPRVWKLVYVSPDDMKGWKRTSD